MRESSAEYRTLIKHTNELRGAIRSRLHTLSMHLYSLKLISGDDFKDLLNETLSEVERSTLLVELVQDKVQQNPHYYRSFIAILQKDQFQCWDILRKLEDTYTYEKEDSKIYACVHMIYKCTNREVSQWVSIILQSNILRRGFHLHKLCKSSTSCLKLVHHDALCS